MQHPFPDPSVVCPLILPSGKVHDATVFLKPLVTDPNFQVGDYTYASADTAPANWTRALAPHLIPYGEDKLIIGKFCQIAHGVTFITASANHRYDGFSTFPFAAFDGGLTSDRASIRTVRADTVIGHDVWFGREVKVLPGARIGSGAIIGAGAVVGGTVEPYSIIVGNPGRVLRMRFSDRVIARLLDIAWWDWPIETVLAHEAAIASADLETLEAAAP